MVPAGTEYCCSFKLQRSSAYIKVLPGAFIRTTATWDWVKLHGELQENLQDTPTEQGYDLLF